MKLKRLFSAFLIMILLTCILIPNVFADRRFRVEIDTAKKNGVYTITKDGLEVDWPSVSGRDNYWIAYLYTKDRDTKKEYKRLSKRRSKFTIPYKYFEKYGEPGKTEELKIWVAAVEDGEVIKSDDIYIDVKINNSPEPIKIEIETPKRNGVYSINKEGLEVDWPAVRDRDNYWIAYKYTNGTSYKKEDKNFRSSRFTIPASDLKKDGELKIWVGAMEDGELIKQGEVLVNIKIDNTQPNDDDFVALLSIFSNKNHSFVTIKNISKDSLTIGLLSNIKPGKTISLGTWQDGHGTFSKHFGNSVDDGIYYNYDAYVINHHNGLQNRVSLTTSITLGELKEITKYIINNDNWTFSNNCSNFAVNIWNIGAAFPIEKFFDRPGVLVDAIKNDKHIPYKTNKEVPYDYCVYYADGTKKPIREDY